MLKYAIIVNSETKVCDVALGTDTEFYKSIGMEEIDVEQAYDGQWYIKGYAPEKPAPTESEIQAKLTAAVQAYMDSTVQTRGYDNIHTACSYCNSTDNIFAAEGLACLAWRDKVWRTCYDILTEVTSGTRKIPTEDELLEELPILDW